MSTRPQAPAADRPSMENLVESGLVALESLHPGGLAITGELAALCHVSAGTKVLDVACGTGETACHLAKTLGAEVCGLDRSVQLLDRARAKAAADSLSIKFLEGDAQALPFPDSVFDVAICECTLCLIDKATVLREMARVVRPGGYVGMHDLFWRDDASDSLKQSLAEAEGEEPETLEGWRRLFAQAGLADIRVIDKSEVKTRWMSDIRRRLGVAVYFKLGLYALRRWGVRGLGSILRSERVFSDERLGYCIVLGIKPRRH